MIVREVIQINDHTIYRNYSDSGVYIRNKETGILYTDVNSSIDYEYEETNIKIEKEAGQYREITGEAYAG